MKLHLIELGTIAAALIGGTYADTMAVFCDDTACSVNCGEAHEVVNTPCQEESNRNSIYFYTPSAYDSWALAWTADECANALECQNSFAIEEGCVDLSGNSWADSFSFRPTC